MENKIVIALRRAYHCEHIRAVLAQNNLHYPVYELSAGAGSFDVLQKAVERGAKVLVTGDTYVDAVMEKVNISVVTLRRGSPPFSDTIRKALSIADRTALVWRENDAPAAQRACGEFGGAAVFYPYQPRRDDLDRLCARLAADGFQAVVGAGILNEPAARYGITVFNVPYADSDILSAVRIAEHNLTSLEERQQYIETLNSIYDNISEGIVLVDPDGVIETVNRAAAEYLQLNAQDLVGSHCDRTPLASAELDALLTGQEAFHNRLLTRRGQGLKFNRRQQYEYHHLAYNFRDKLAEPSIVTVREDAPGTQKQAHSHEGQEFDYVLEGTLKIVLGGNELYLQPGDSLYYDSSLPHVMYAVEGDCRFIAVVIKEGAKA